MEFSRFRLSTLILCLLLVVCNLAQAAEDGEVGGASAGQASISVTIVPSFELIVSGGGGNGLNRSSGELHVRSNDIGFDVYQLNREGRVIGSQAGKSPSIWYASNIVGEVLILVPR